eukprot:755206-Hanusia_phi.AAC.8
MAGSKLCRDMEDLLHRFTTCRSESSRIRVSNEKTCAYPALVFLILSMFLWDRATSVARSLNSCLDVDTDSHYTYTSSSTSPFPWRVNPDDAISITKLCSKNAWFDRERDRGLLHMKGLEAESSDLSSRSEAVGIQTSSNPGVQASLDADEPPSLYHSASKVGAVSTPSLQLSDNGGAVIHVLNLTHAYRERHRSRKDTVPTLPTIANETLVSEKPSLNETYHSSTPAQPTSDGIELVPFQATGLFLPSSTMTVTKSSNRVMSEQQQQIGLRQMIRQQRLRTKYPSSASKENSTISPVVYTPMVSRQLVLIGHTPNVQSTIPAPLFLYPSRMAPTALQDSHQIYYHQVTSVQNAMLF